MEKVSTIPSVPAYACVYEYQYACITYYKKEGSQCLYKFVSSVQTVQCSVEAGTMKRATMNVIKMEI